MGHLGSLVSAGVVIFFKCGAQFYRVERRGRFYRSLVVQVGGAIEYVCMPTRGYLLHQVILVTIELF